MGILKKQHSIEAALPTTLVKNNCAREFSKRKKKEKKKKERKKERRKKYYLVTQDHAILD